MLSPPLRGSAQVEFELDILRVALCARTDKQPMRRQVVEIGADPALGHASSPALGEHAVHEFPPDTTPAVGGNHVHIIDINEIALLGQRWKAIAGHEACRALALECGEHEDPAIRGRTLQMSKPRHALIAPLGYGQRGDDVLHQLSIGRGQSAHFPNAAHDKIR
jgi:hypothetical protein